MLAQSTATRGPTLFAGLGLDFANRRRNKVAGTIQSASIRSDSQHHVELTLATNENLGNCPKYITVRQLARHDGPSEVIASRASPAGVALDPASLAILARASTVFLATRHAAAAPADADLGLNHRGGRPGFVRAYADAGGATLVVLPDYSGNRFYQSLGSVQSDAVAALLVPDFATGDVLHITGDAENIFGPAADRLMPRAALVTRIRVTACVAIRGGLGVRAVGPEELSPYCPPVRLLAVEIAAAAAAAGPSAGLASGDGADADGDGGDATATLVAARRLTASVSAFTFRLGRPVRLLPGGHVILDFSRVAAAARPYAHMDDARPQSLNDDGVRAWTVSSPPPFDPAAAAFAPAAAVTVTVRRVPGGAVSPLLHAAAARPGPPAALAARLVGAGGGFSCFDAAGGVADAAMVWVAGGVGITPFLAMLAALAAARRPVDIALLYSGRGDDAALAAPFLAAAAAGPAAGPAVRVVIFDTADACPAPDPATAAGGGGGTLVVHRRRMAEADVAAVAGVAGRAASLCGPAGLMAAAAGWLARAGVDPARTHRESFAF